MSERLARATLPAAVSALITAAAAALLLPEPAAAHGLVGRSDLPLPEWLLLWGAALLLIGSFAALVFAWREPRLEADSWRPVNPTLSRLLVNPVTRTLCGLIGVALLLLTVYAGIEGTNAPDRNFAVVFVFITFWLGFVVLGVLFGDLFRAFNPWLAIGRAVSKGFELLAGQRAPAPLRYPEWLGRWPAAVGLAAFIWFELIWGQSGFEAAGVSPHDVAVATLVYSVITFVGMGLFGVEKWSRRGETFSVYFGMFASLGPLAVRDGRLGRRRLFSGSTSWADQPGSLGLVLVAIGCTTFDGASEGLLSEPIRSLFESLSDGGMAPIEALRISNSVYFLLTLLAVAAIFWAGIRGMRLVETERGARELGRSLAHAFIPIALAYLVAHYFSAFVFLEQAQFTYLLSDPLGDGSDLFGTLGDGIDYGVIGATAIQWVQFGAIVVGHAIALALAHDRALVLFGDPREAAWSQAWMLVMMIAFSTLGLYLLSQANA
jgi:hypothetical protein